MKKTLKIIVLALSILMITSSFSMADRWNRRPHVRQCWNVMWTERVAKYVSHHFVDRDCDRRVDIVQEYRWNGYRWVPTRWWWYR